LERRTAIKSVALLLGGALSGPTLSAMAVRNGELQPDWVPGALNFTTNQQALLAEIAETIIPTTSTPGAKAAGVGPFIELMIKDCYLPAQQQHFMKGLADIDAESMKNHGKNYVSLSNEQRIAVMTTFEQKAIDERKQAAVTVVKADVDAETGNVKEVKAKASDPLVPFFSLAKELTLLGYFSSEIGATKALRYVAVPGRFEGSVPYKKGDKAWAT
jgi:Gluconate 2-dehydrogenase subunit 3